MPVRCRFAGSLNQSQTGCLPLRQMPHVGWFRRHYPVCPQSEDFRRGTHRPLPFVRMGGTLFLQTMWHAPVRAGGRGLLHQRRPVCRQCRFRVGNADFYRLQSTVLRLGQRHAQAHRKRVSGHDRRVFAVANADWS